MCDNCPSKTTERGAEWTRETSKPTGERPLPVPSGRDSSDNELRNNLARITAGFFMATDPNRVALQKLLTEYIQTNYMPKQAIDAAVKEAEETILFEITGDLYEIADQEEKPKKVWERHRKYLDRLAKLNQPQEKK